MFPIKSLEDSAVTYLLKCGKYIRYYCHCKYDDIKGSGGSYNKGGKVGHRKVQVEGRLEVNLIRKR